MFLVAFIIRQAADTLQYCSDSRLKQDEAMDLFDGKYSYNYTHMFYNLVVGMAACICTHSMGKLTSAHIHLFRKCPSYKFLDLRLFKKNTLNICLSCKVYTYIYIYTLVWWLVKRIFMQTFLTFPSFEGFGTVTLEFIPAFGLTLSIVKARVWVALTLGRQQFMTRTCAH